VRVLVGASDGIDGTGPEAGAIVDGDTWSRVALAGVDPEDALARCDAGPALAAIGAGLAGGPTGVNHADLVVVVRERRGSHEHP
jgi:hydroxypyruvate reductase